MRRVFVYLLTFILIFFCLPFSAAAASDVLTIDNAHRYDGMNQTYAQGYLPIVSEGKASIVLPLLSDIPLENNRINVALGLGDTSSAPFVYNSYNRDFSLEDYAVDDGADTVSAYLVSFELPLKSNRVNGVYPVTATITAKTADGNPINQTYTFYITVTDGTDPNQSEEPPAENEPPAPIPVTISVDNINTYPGMVNSYAQGYVPTVADGKAHILLPLLVQGDISGSLTVKPDLGNPQDTPFVFANYEKSVAESTYQFGSQNVKAYLADFTIPLASNRSNGYYPVVFEATSTDKNGKQFNFSYTVYVTITDGKDPARDGQETPTSSPKLIVSGRTTEPDEIKAGDNFKTLVTIKNTSSIKAVQNITVQVSSSSEDVFLENDSTTFYFPNLDAGKTLSIDLMMRSTLNVKPGRYFLNLDISYDDMKANPLTFSEKVAIDIGQHFNVVLETPQIDKNVYAGDTIPLEFKVINMGRSSVHNVQCELTGFGLFPDGSAYFGSLEAESESSKEINIFIGSLDMSEGYTGTDKYGFTEGTITLTYEDDDGTQYSGTYTIQTTIKAAEVPEETKEADTVGQWWVSVFIAMILVSISGSYLLWRRKRRIKTYEEK